MPECEPVCASPPVEPVLAADEQVTCNEEEMVAQPNLVSAVPAVRAKASTFPIAASLGALGVAVVAGLISTLLKRAGKKKLAAPQATDTIPKPTFAVPVSTGTAPQPTTEMEVDLSPFGSPVGNTPVRLPPAHKSEEVRPRAADSDADDQSDNASVRDQRHNLIDVSQLQKTLKQMQEMAEENRKLSAFLAEYKADAEKLSRLEEENRSLRDVTRQLEVELQDLKTNTLPRTGAELEMFKNSVRVPATARSVCSNDETIIGLGVSTASVDAAAPDARIRRTNVFKQLLATLQGTSSTGTSQPATPRGISGSAAAGVTPHGGGSTAGSSRQRRQPGPEEAAVIGQAVYQLLDQFGGRMM